MDASGGNLRAWVRTPLALLAALVVVGAAVMLLPGARAEVARSTTKQGVHYLELYLDGAKAPSCAAIARSRHVRFAVTSHLAESQRLSYVVSADQKRVALGQLETTPGRTTTARPTVRFDPKHTDQLVVGLVGRAEHLTVHCGKGSGA